MLWEGIQDGENIRADTVSLLWEYLGREIKGRHRLRHKAWDHPHQESGNWLGNFGSVVGLKKRTVVFADCTMSVKNDKG